MRRGLLGTVAVWMVGAIALRVVVIPGASCPPVSPGSAMAAAEESAAWMARVQRPDGSYLYEYDRDDDREPADYNIVRHAGVTMSLYQLAGTGNAVALATADRGLEWMEGHLYQYADWAALQDPVDGAIEVGAAALLLAGLAQRRLATGDAGHDALMREVGRFLLRMQKPDGGFLLAWVPADEQPDPYLVSKYATGEAFWAIALMHRVFPTEGWDRPARAVADYLSNDRDRLEGHDFPPWADQWAAYGLAEMADWPISDANARYARSLAERFGFLVRVESQRADSWFSKLVHGRQARAAGMGTWVEGLTSLWRLASADPRLKDIEPRIAERAVCGAGMLIERQQTAREADGWPRPDVVRGAWFTNGVTRMDDQQHALSGILRAVPILEAGQP